MVVGQRCLSAVVFLEKNSKIKEERFISQSSEAYWMVSIEVATITIGETYRGGFVPAKVDVSGLSFGTAHLIWRIP